MLFSAALPLILITLQRQLIHLGNDGDHWCYGVQFVDRQLRESDCIDILAYRTPTPLKVTKATRLGGADGLLLAADLGRKPKPVCVIATLTMIMH